MANSYSTCESPNLHYPISALSSLPFKVVSELMSALWGLLKPNSPLGFKVRRGAPA